jgi:hypothetical protein
VTGALPPLECALGVEFRLHGWAFAGFYKRTAQDYVLGAVLRDRVSLADLLAALEVPEPPLLGAVHTTLEKLDFLIKGGEITLDGRVSIDWHLPFDEDLRLQVDALDVRVALTRPKLGVASCAVTAHGRVTRDGEALVDPFRFAFKYDKAGWDVQGQAAVTFLDKRLCLSASFRQRDVLSFQLAARQDLTLLDLDRLASLSLTGLGIEIRRDGTAAAATRSQWHGEVTVTGSLSIADLLHVEGSLRLSDSGLRFEPAEPVTFDLPIVKRGALDVGVSTRLKALTIRWSGDTKGVEEDVSVTLRTEGLPAFIRDAIPGTIAASFFVGTRSGRSAVELTLKDAGTKLQNARIEIGAGAETTEIDLSVLNGAQFGLTRVGLRGGHDLTVFVGLAVQLPPTINGIFGTTGGQPNLTLLRTAPDPIEFEFSLRASPFGAGFAFLTPPLAERWIQTEDADRRWEITLGEGGRYGQVSIGAPFLNLSGKGFGSNGEVTVLKALKIPLAPLRQLVGHLAGQAEAQEIIPEAVPIVVPSLLDRDGNLVFARLLDWIEETFEPSAGEGLKNALHEVQGIVKVAQVGVDRLPADLKPYLEPQFENGFEGLHLKWDITVGEDASVTVDLSSKQPIRLLMPMGPNLVGFKLSRLAFGALLGGSLFKLKLTCDFDQFDLAGIIVDLVVPKDSQLPITRDFHNQLIIQDLLAIIVYETVVPIPVPIYFQKLGLDVVQLLGLSVQSHTDFQLSEFSLAGLLNLLQESGEFFKNPEKPLKLSPQALDLFPTLSLHDWYVQLPGWLADAAYLGRKGTFFTLHSAQIVEDVLNTIKFFSFAKVISRIPVADRLGELEWAPKAFLGLTLDASAAWLMLTGSEFEQLRQSSGTYRAVVGDDEQARALVETFAGAAALDDQSAICLVKAGVELDLFGVEVEGLDVRFGFISVKGSSSQATAWETAFAIGGRLGPFTLEAHGLVAMDLEPARFVAHTDCALRFFDWELFTAQQDLEVTTDGFDLDGHARVLPRAQVEWEAHCSIHPGVGANVTAGGDASFLGLALASAKFVAKNVKQNGQLESEITLAGTFLGADLTLTAARDEHSLQYGGTSANLFGSNTFEISYSENQAFRTSFRAEVVGGHMGYHVVFTGPDPQKPASGPLSGRFELTMLEVSVFSGHAWVDPGNNTYAVGGSINLIPPNPLGIQITVESQGTLSGDGLTLTGGFKPHALGSLLTLEGSATLTARQKTQGISGSASVRTIGLASVAARYGVVVSGGEVCFCLSWDLWWWKWYVMISGAGVYGPATTAPPGWPSILEAPAALRVSAPVPVPAYADLLAFLKRVYANGQMPLLADGHYRKFGRLMEVYEIETWFDRAPDQQTDGPVRAKIIVRRPRDTEQGIFAEVRQAVMIRARADKEASLARALALDTLQLEGVMGEGSARAIWLASETKQTYETVLRDFDRVDLDDIAQEIIKAG